MLETVRTFTALSEEFVEIYMRYHPVEATAVGIHDYDDRLPQDTPDAFREESSWLRDLEQRLVASVPWDELPLEQRVEFALLRSRIASGRADLEEIRPQAHDASRAPRVALRGLQLLFARPFAPLEERKEPLLARMMAVPEHLERARTALDQVSEVSLELAAEIGACGPVLVDDIVRSLLRTFSGEAERVEHAGERARVGFLQYQEFLDREVRPKAVPAFAIGERWMNYKCEREHLLSMDCAFLEDMGRRTLEEARAALAEEAGRADPARDWRAQLAEARTRHPEPLRLREAYQAEVERARRFVIEHRVVPVPELALELADTPLHERPLTPVARYERPGPLDAEQTGVFQVTPADPGGPGDAQELQLGAHAYAALPLTVVHDTYPGQHVQAAHAGRAGSRLRRLADSRVFAEGWALYCEELMWRSGYFLDPATRLFQLRDLAWRACRMLIDVGLHCGRMTLDQAAALLVDEVMLHPAAARGEVRAAALRPTHGLGHLVGRTLMIELRDEVRRRLGDRFHLPEFHTALLKSGTLPPFLLREELWERLPQP